MSEDLKPSGDVTSKFIKKNKKIKAKIISNQSCVIGGLNLAKETFKTSDKKIVFITKTKDGKDSHSLNLADTVRLWPTPRVSDTEGGVVKNVELNNGNFSRTNKKGVRWGVKLKDAVSHVEMLPTPTARDWKGGRKPETLKKAGRTENNSLPDKVNAQIKTTGSLNPDWVEWLMGYGQGYTDPDNKSSFTLDSHEGFPNEPDIARVTTENQYRKDRLKALGNSIVPQIAYHIGNAILEQEAK